MGFFKAPWFSDVYYDFFCWVLHHLLKLSAVDSFVAVGKGVCL
jgi:hypothetical protein